MKYTYCAVYKCRLCSNTFRLNDKTFTMEYDSIPELIGKTIQNNQLFAGHPYLERVPMILPHRCLNHKDGGIADLAGYKVIENEEKKRLPWKLSK